MEQKHNKKQQKEDQQHDGTKYIDTVEKWFINKKNGNVINATEMNSWRKNCRVPRMRRIANEEIRRRLKKEKKN